jgi:type II secretory pathway predicted ATPase ExeA
LVGHLPARGHWSERKYLLFELLIQYGVECLIIDDAHDLSMPHLIFLKELTDQLQKEEEKDRKQESPEEPHEPPPK